MNKKKHYVTRRQPYVNLMVLHLGSLGKWSLINMGSSANSIRGLPSKIIFNFSSQLTMFLLFGSCLETKTIPNSMSLFFIFLVPNNIETKVNKYAGQQKFAG